MGSRNGVEGRDTVLVRSFYKAGTKMTPRFRDGVGVSGSRNGTLDPESCDYACVRRCGREPALGLWNDGLWVIEYGSRIKITHRMGMVQAKRVLRPLNKGDCLCNHLTVTTPRHTSSLFEAQVPLVRLSQLGFCCQRQAQHRWCFLDSISISPMLSVEV